MKQTFSQESENWVCYQPRCQSFFSTIERLWPQQQRYSSKWRMIDVSMTGVARTVVQLFSVRRVFHRRGLVFSATSCKRKEYKTIDIFIVTIEFLKKWTVVSTKIVFVVAFFPKRARRVSQVPRSGTNYVSSWLTIGDHVMSFSFFSPFFLTFNVSVFSFPYPFFIFIFFVLILNRFFVYYFNLTMKLLSATWFLEHSFHTLNRC